MPGLPLPGTNGASATDAHRWPPAGGRPGHWPRRHRALGERRVRQLPARR